MLAGNADTLNRSLLVFMVILTLTLHVIALECLANVERGRAQEQVGLQLLLAPHIEIQLAGGRHGPAGKTQTRVC